MNGSMDILKNKRLIRQLILFFFISNGVTILQLFLMPFLKYLFSYTSLTAIPFQIFPIGCEVDGSIQYLFDYADGRIQDGGGGGLAYFLAVEITLLLAQIVNFFLQRKITFQSNVNVIRAAVWYFAVWVLISIGAGLLNGLYKEALYGMTIYYLGEHWGIVVGDVVTMLINCILSFWIFFPVMRYIFRSEKKGR